MHLLYISFSLANERHMIKLYLRELANVRFIWHYRSKLIWLVWVIIAPKFLHSGDWWVLPGK